MNQQPTIIDAITALGVDGGFKIQDGKISKWYSEKPQPSEDAIQAKLTELVADYESKAYQRNRQYPNIGDQLDMIYWDKVNGTGKWKETIDKVKADHPKPD